MNTISELVYAITKEHKSKIYDLLVRQEIQPTVECLQMAIRIREHKLIATFIGYPYFLKPNADCLAEAISTNHTSLVMLLIAPEYELIPNEACLRAAIRQANVIMVRYILHMCPTMIVTTSHLDCIDDLQYEKYNQKIEKILRETMDRQTPKPLPFDFLVGET